MFFRQPMIVVVRAELYCVHNTVLNTFKGTTVLYLQIQLGFSWTLVPIKLTSRDELKNTESEVNNIERLNSHVKHHDH